MDELKAFLEGRIQRAREGVGQFADHFKNDPVRALEGSYSVFRCVACIEVCQQVLLNIEREMTLEAIRNDLVSRVAFLGRMFENGSRSNARLMDQHRLAELSDLIYCGKW